MLTAEPELVSPSAVAPSRGHNSGEISYPEVAAKASTLAQSIAALARNKSHAERRRLCVLRDVAEQLHGCLTHVGVR
jgi:hypothetical protein